MGSFICSISERDWEVSRTKGVYGNKAGKIDDKGRYREFAPKTKYSIIRDLIGMKEGDKVFFHVLSESGPSRIHGIYVVRNLPFYHTQKIWNDPYELYPYRFLFKPHPSYDSLCEYGGNIEVVDFYELIEQRKIWSLVTLENEINIEARSIRKIEDGKDTEEIMRLLHRDFKCRRLNKKITFSPIPLSSQATPLRNFVKDIGNYENSIKALLMYKMSQNDPTIINILGSVSDFMNEVFIAQTTRKMMDILSIQNLDANSKRYIISEVKTYKCQSDSLWQVLHYMDLFKQKELVNIHSDIVDGCLIGQRFDDEVIDFTKRRNAQGVNGNILLIQYNPIKNGSDANFQRIA